MESAGWGSGNGDTQISRSHLHMTPHITVSHNPTFKNLLSKIIGPSSSALPALTGSSFPGFQTRVFFPSPSWKFQGLNFPFSKQLMTPLWIVAHSLRTHVGNQMLGTILTYKRPPSLPPPIIKLTDFLMWRLLLACLIQLS